MTILTLLQADKDHKTIVDIDAQIVAMDNKVRLCDEMQKQIMNPNIPQK